MPITTATYDDEHYQVVPKQPTDDMRDRGNEVMLDRGKLFHVWGLMLAAAPTLPSVQEVPDIEPWENLGPNLTALQAFDAVRAERTEYRAFMVQLKGKK